MQLQTKIVTEAEILAVACPKCNAVREHGCLDAQRHVLYHRLGDTELTFHPERIRAAQDEKISAKFGKVGSTEKALICYAAFQMLAESVSLKSVEVLGRAFTPDQILTFFAQQAVDVLVKEGLIRSGVVCNNWRTK